MTALLLAAVLGAAPASCPSTRPADTAAVTWVCIEGGWQPTAPTPAPAPAPPPADCANIDVYAEPERAATCAAIPPPPLDTPTFLVGAVYRYGYDAQRARVLAIGQDLDGVQVVTLRWLVTSGSEGLAVVRTPPTPGGTSTWTRVP